MHSHRHMANIVHLISTSSFFFHFAHVRVVPCPCGPPLESMYVCNNNNSLVGTVIIQLFETRLASLLLCGEEKWLALLRPSKLFC